MKEDSTGVKL